MDNIRRETSTIGRTSPPCGDYFNKWRAPRREASAARLHTGTTPTGRQLSCRDGVVGPRQTRVKIRRLRPPERPPQSPPKYPPRREDSLVNRLQNPTGPAA